MQVPAINELRCFFISRTYTHRHMHTMHETRMSEYCNVVRIRPGRTLPSGYTLVPASSPAVLQQLCRTFTLARGLTLHEVWDEWNQTVTGYLIPSAVFGIAHEYRSGVSVARWSTLPVHERNRLKYARALLLEQFPRMPEIAAIRIAERAQREQWNGEKRKLEERAINHIRHEWTSYEAHFNHYQSYPQATGSTTADANPRESKLSRKKDVVLEAVKPRIRDVLISWLPKELTAADLASLVQRYNLYDSASGNRSYKQGSVLARTSCLRYHGGLETPANLLAKTELIM